MNSQTFKIIVGSIFQNCRFSGDDVFCDAVGLNCCGLSEHLKKEIWG